MTSVYCLLFFALVSNISGFWLDPKDRIISGKESEQNAHPFLVTIQDVTPPVIHFCGGALINSRTILTAAHCIYNTKTKVQLRPDEISVVLGEHNIKKKEGTEVKRGVRKVIKHEVFPNGPKKFDSDIALLILDQPVEYNDVIKPICLNSNKNIGRIMTTVAGWGQTLSDFTSNILMETDLPIIDSEVCNKKLKYFFYEPNMLCVGYPHMPDGFPDVCYGDSGGPVFIKSGGEKIQIGIVSCGSLKGCAVEGDPSGLTKVAAYIPWINENSIGDICVV